MKYMALAIPENRSKRVCNDCVKFSRIFDRRRRFNQRITVRVIYIDGFFDRHGKLIDVLIGMGSMNGS